jgi:hypothetical protein
MPSTKAPERTAATGIRARYGCWKGKTATPNQPSNLYTFAPRLDLVGAVTKNFRECDPRLLRGDQA